MKIARMMVAKAKSIVVLTGAGISAESGIPTFRDAQTGLWAKHSPEELATSEAFERNPGLVWSWYAHRRAVVKLVQPNAGHYALVKMALNREFTLITQNVDSLHQRAGSQNVLELHGSILRAKCFTEGKIFHKWPETDKIPKCDCGAYLRPDVVWFGESLAKETLDKAFEVAQKCDLFISIGTSSLVQPAALLPLIAIKQGAQLLEINKEETSLTKYATHAVQGSSGILLPMIMGMWKYRLDVLK